MSAFKPVGEITLAGKSYYLDICVEGAAGDDVAKIESVALRVFKTIAETNSQDLLKLKNEGISLTLDDFKKRAEITAPTPEPRVEEPEDNQPTYTPPSPRKVATVTEIDSDNETETAPALPAKDLRTGEKRASRIPEPVNSARKSHPIRTSTQQAARWRHFRDEVYKPIIENRISLEAAIQQASQEDRAVLNKLAKKYREYQLEGSQKNLEIFESTQGQGKLIRVKTFGECLKEHVASRDKPSTASGLFAKFKGLIS